MPFSLHSHRRPVAAIIACLGLLASGVTQGAGTEIIAPTIEVIGASPVRGLDIPRNDIPSPVQSLSSRVLEENRSQTLPELLNSRLAGISANETTGNPFQTEVNYRGFTASPLLGTPQGLSVYQDGVRINEPFGDIVNWDLIPHAAIAGIDLIPGSNPLFGLNTLGGALSITTKSGLTHTGASLETGIGSHGRREVEAEIGRKFGDMGFYVAGSAFREDGWRDASPSRVKQIFAKLSQQRGELEWDLAYTGARTNLTGNGLLPDSMLQQRRTSIFTLPDNTRHQLDMLNFTAGYWLDDNTRLTGLLYHRSQKVRTLNGDANDDFAGDIVLDGNEGANGGLGLNEETAVNNRTRSNQRSWGAALQWVRSNERNHLAVGATIDHSRSSFEQSAETGVFDATRRVADVDPAELENRVDGRTHSWSLFLSDTWKMTESLALTGSLRYNRTRVTTDDKLNPVPPNLDGDYTYSKLNPALGAAWTFMPSITLFANVTQGNRAPSPIELGCADPANPCSLPNAMQADPYLKQVVTRTLEVGARGTANGVRWNATVFRANNFDDILFVGTSTSAGYFTNFGRTRREGIELGATTELGAVALRADYTYVKATYQSAACLLGEHNSTRGQSAACTTGGQDDEILVQSSDRIPGIPLSSFKFGADWRVSSDWTISADLVAFSSQYLRGNENNQHRAGSATDMDGETRRFLGSGKAGGYAVVNLATRYKVGKDWTLSARIGNLFDRHYATAGALAENPFDAAGRFQTHSGNWTQESFFAPGAPRNLFVGLSLDLN